MALLAFSSLVLSRGNWHCRFLVNISRTTMYICKHVFLFSYIYYFVLTLFEVLLSRKLSWFCFFNFSLIDVQSTYKSSKLCECANGQHASLLHGSPMINRGAHRVPSTSQPGPLKPQIPSQCSALFLFSLVELTHKPTRKPFIFLVTNQNLAEDDETKEKFGAQLKIQLGKPTLSWNNKQPGGLNLAWNLEYGQLACPQPPHGKLVPGSGARRPEGTIIFVQTLTLQ